MCVTVPVSTEAANLSNAFFSSFDGVAANYQQIQPHVGATVHKSAGALFVASKLSPASFLDEAE